MEQLPLILLPGTLCDARLWQSQIAALSAELPVHVGDLTQHASIAEQAMSVLAAGPPRFALAGLSLGGIVALEIVRRAPERVSRLALLSTTARPASAAQREQWRELAGLTRAWRLAELVRDQLLPKLVSAEGLRLPGVAATIEAMAQAVGPAGYLRQLAALETRIDSRPHLSRVTCPTLVLAAEADVVCPAELSAELAAGIPGAWLQHLPGCGHLSTLEQPRPVVDALSAWLGADPEGTL